MMPNPLLSICLSSLPLCKLLSVAISHNLIRQAYLRHNCHLSACCSSAVASQYSLSPSCQHHYYYIIPMTVWADLQAALQELSKQLNQQIQVYTRRGFQIKDVNSGMTHGFGKEPSAPKHLAFISCNLLRVLYRVFTGVSVSTCFLLSHTWKLTFLPFLIIRKHRIEARLVLHRW